MHEDGAGLADLKITNTTLKELRYAFKVYAPYRDVRKVTVFGSARTPARTRPRSRRASSGDGWSARAGWS